MIGQQIEGHIMAADGHNGLLNLAGRTQQFNRHLFTSMMPFREAWDRHNAVGFHQRTDHAGPTGQGRRYDFIADFANGYP